MSKFCTVGGCKKTLLAVGLCGMHYWRMRKHGSVDLPSRATPIQERFWKFVQRCRGTSCWPWTGSLSTNGYGQIYGIAGKPAIASRVSYEINVGAIPDGTCVLHRCDNPRCVNPGHLFLGTRKENALDMVSKDRHARGEKHPSAKLTDDIVTGIKGSSKSGRSIALALGVSRSLVTAIRRGKKWAHVSAPMR